MEQGGEDAFFIVTGAGAALGAMSEGGLGGALGVVDGVGGWVTDGVDVAAYSRGICEEMAVALEASQGTCSECGTATTGADCLRRAGSTGPVRDRWARRRRSKGCPAVA